jgi:hypothetical protein
MNRSPDRDALVIHSGRHDTRRRTRLQEWSRWLGGFVIVASLPFVTQIEGGNEALRDLPGVAVIGEATSPELRSYGVTEEWLEHQASSLLERAGVPRLARSDAASSTRQPLLSIRLESVRLPDSRAFAWYLSVAVHQRTITLASPPDTLLTQAWSATGTLGITSGRILKDSLRETLAAKIGEFVKAWNSQRR